MAAATLAQRLFVDPERRLANFNNSYNSLAELPEGVTQSVIGVTASDGAASVGVLHRPRRDSRICAFYMHPRTNQTRPYLAPALLASGISVWGQMSRHVNNDIDMTHEEILLDAAAGMRLLREQGFETIVAIGNSGGSSLLAYYQSQASTPPGERQELSPAGEPTYFATEEMPEFDLYVALAPHLGEGTILLRLLDPAVVDEANPVATDSSLDMFDPRNGYCEFPKPSQYESEWVDRYRTEQVARCRRLDNLALSLLQDYDEARALADPRNLASATARRAMFARLMIIHRTAANPGHLDPRIAPNRRPIGYHGGEHPARNNLGFHGFARVLTPRAWLSTWSGLSSKAELLHSIRRVRIPTLFVYPDGDLSCLPDDIAALLESSGAQDKTLEVIEWGLHYLASVPGMPARLPPPKERAGTAVVAWLNARLELA